MKALTKSVAVVGFVCAFLCAIMAYSEPDPSETIAWSVVVLLYVKELFVTYSKNKSDYEI